MEFYLLVLPIFQTPILYLLRDCIFLLLFVTKFFFELVKNIVEKYLEI